MKERAKEVGFFIAVFVAIVWLLSFLAPSTETASSTPQIILPEFSTTDWIMATVAIAVPPLMILTVYFLQVFGVAFPRMQTEGDEVAIVQPEPAQSSAHERPIIYRGPSPEKVNRLEAELSEALRKCEDLQAQLNARPAAEPERELTYQAVLALIQTGGNIGINAAQELVRKKRGIAGRDYAPLQEVLKALRALSAPYPAVQDTPIHESKQAVHEVNEGGTCRVNGEAGTRKTRLPRKRRGW